MEVKEKFIKLLVYIGYEGWFSLFMAATVVNILAQFVPMFTALIFGICMPWFIEFLQWLYNNIILQKELKQTVKIPIMCIIGGILGFFIAYIWIINPISEIIWF